MKNLIIVICSILLLPLFSSAQKIRFTDSTNQWITSGSCADCMFFNRSYSYFHDYYSHDTFMHGYQYHQLICTGSFDASVCAGICNPVFAFYVREDTITNKVYYLHMEPSTGNDTSEHILYDYNLSVGDTIAYNLFYFTWTDSVVSIDSFTYLGYVYKTITLRNKQMDSLGYVHRAYTVVEGLGSTVNPIAPAFLQGCFEYDERLVCFAYDSMHPDISAPYSFCSSSPGTIFTDTFNNTGGCISLSSNKINKQAANLVILPNPATDYITISSNTAFNNHTFVSAYDMTGRCVLKTKAEQKNELTINTSAWSAGLYMVIIQNNEGIVKKEKVVVVK